MKLNLLTLALASSLVALLVGCDSTTPQAGFQMPPQQVDTVTLESKTVLFEQQLPARAVAASVAEVRPQVSGIILKRLFDEGSTVQAGDALYQIDDAIYQANLASAKAELLRSKANLQSKSAELKRYQQLLKDNAASQQAFDQVQADYLAEEAELAVRKAAVHRAEVDISFTKVLAPISGIISKSNMTEGALVTAAQSQVLTTITQLDPIYFDLVQANNQLRNIRTRLASGELQQVEQVARLDFSNGQSYGQTGQLQFNEVQTNPSTDTVTLRVQFSNPEQHLLPGMYGQVNLVQAQRDNSILVPQKAVTFDRGGKANVFVLAKENKVEARRITVGRSFGQNWLVLSGLNSGEKVITTGLQKIGPGMVVVPVSDTKQAG
ncbi:efflux RND transporter periplasmic adaptor subunit [Psychrobium sp. 1_MG-2023]|uniref:efflux RND transporter periplasmic adaptor subunit n=1 Tax=Psychrobium sp. 1_MG-2023 TaxID=3062624 RepID=UPI000C32EEA6|nr:efflux RND transporter periplasmic adaptor subunit [Psychrobium sp. 1_MG-2023]MDP2559699.1 efflux RND transporter periplasmic adaptor subunit [Psychrobium sp. 1_MG-2023]PKF59529.1 efflux RND transporter periplasmic adaptor subunit [Alteromonadales bacterium alter-6D02]